MSRRRQLGAFYTPPELAASLAASTLGPLIDAGYDPDRLRVCDPAVGAGALLSAAVSYLVSRGASVATATANMTGVDIDGAAVASARDVLGPGATLEVGDALSIPWDGGFDAILANPPFLGQLKRDTARTGAASASAVSRFGAAAAGYADTAALFLMLSVELAPQVGIILPTPLLGTAGSRAARQRVGAVTRLVQSWSPAPRSFDACVRTTVLVLERSSAAPAEWREGRWTGRGTRGRLAVVVRFAGVRRFADRRRFAVVGRAGRRRSCDRRFS